MLQWKIDLSLWCRFPRVGFSSFCFPTTEKEDFVNFTPALCRRCLGARARMYCESSIHRDHKIEIMGTSGELSMAC